MFHDVLVPFAERWTIKMKKIYANYNNEVIRVYQAYCDNIADEAIQKGTFGRRFSLDRMTWIKPSFLWMMYRSGWGTKEGQNRILAIDLKRSGFDTIVDNAVLSYYNEQVYNDYEDWKRKLNFSDVRCQWDPDRDIHGNPLLRRAIQLGIRGEYVKKYVNEWIVSISDITNFVEELRRKKEKMLDIIQYLPKEKEYPKLTEIME